MEKTVIPNYNIISMGPETGLIFPIRASSGPIRPADTHKGKKQLIEW